MLNFFARTRTADPGALLLLFQEFFLKKIHLKLFCGFFAMANQYTAADPSVLSQIELIALKNV